MVWKEIGMKKKSSPVLLKVSVKNKTKPDGCHMSVIPALGQWRLENWEFKAILSHVMSLSVLDHITPHLRRAWSRTLGSKAFGYFGSSIYRVVDW